MDSRNGDFRYQLTSLGGFAPLYVADEIANNQFTIAGGRLGMRVSWQVTGVRRDAWAMAHRIPVEVDKSEKERGRYLHPELFGALPEEGIDRQRHSLPLKTVQAMRDRAFKHLSEVPLQRKPVGVPSLRGAIPQKNSKSQIIGRPN